MMAGEADRRDCDGTARAPGWVPLPASGHAVDLCVYVPDLDAAVAAAPHSGGQVAVPPTDTPWGERVAYLRDPQGTMILTIQDDEPEAKPPEGLSAKSG